MVISFSCKVEFPNCVYVPSIIRDIHNDVPIFYCTHTYIVLRLAVARFFSASPRIGFFSAFFSGWRPKIRLKVLHVKRTNNTLQYKVNYIKTTIHLLHHRQSTPPRPLAFCVPCLIPQSIWRVNRPFSID